MWNEIGRKSEGRVAPCSSLALHKVRKQLGIEPVHTVSSYPFNPLIASFRSVEFPVSFCGKELFFLYSPLSQYHWKGNFPIIEPVYRSRMEELTKRKIQRNI